MPTTSDPIVLSAARWFWWIAGLSLVNVILLQSGSDTNFVVGLAMTTLAMLAFRGAAVIGWAIAAVLIGFYGAMGLYAQRQRLWAFYWGLALYALDAAIYLAFQDWMPFGFHLLAGYFIFKGIRQVKALASAPPKADA